MELWSYELGNKLRFLNNTLSVNGGVNAGIVVGSPCAPVPGVPKFNTALTGQYNFNYTDNAQSFVRGAAHWTGASNGTLDPTSPDYQCPAYSVVGASTGVKFEPWDLSLHVKNIANNQKNIQRPEVQVTADEVYRMSRRTVGFTVSGSL